MTFRRTALTRKDFQNRVENFLTGAMGWHCMAEVAAANGYPDRTDRWRDGVERILFIDLSFFISSVTTKTSFDRRRAVKELIAEHNSAKRFQTALLLARRTLSTRYLKRPHAALNLPDMEMNRNAVWLLVSEAVSLALEKL